jgi:hypothetical protein
MSAPTIPGTEPVVPCSVVIAATSTRLTITVHGDVDAGSWPAVEQAMSSCLVVAQDEIVVDLAGTTFVSLASCCDLHRAVRALLDQQRRVHVVPSRALARAIGILTEVGALPGTAARELLG